MEALRFDLKGKTAFFKNPEVNTYYYFTFGQIHKPALLGMFGAILGYKGYEDGYLDYPQYYKELRDIHVSIVPNSKNGYFQKKIQIYNNSVGYAQKEQGGNLIIKEQWIEDPSWTIYILLDNTKSGELAKTLLDHKCIYMPYLGKNDHPATIENVVKVELNEAQGSDIELHSFTPENTVSFDWDESSFKYAEYLPIELKETTNHYILEKMILTDAPLIESEVPIYSDGKRNITFY